MDLLKGNQKKYLRGLAHGKKPVVMIGQNGITDGVLKSIRDALEKHELIKIKLIDVKDKAEKKAMLEEIQERSKCSLVGMIGHVGIFYKTHKDPKKRKISLPGIQF